MHCPCIRALVLIALGFGIGASLTAAAPVTVTLAGEGATGALNIVGFDNEINEPNGPPSREHAFEGNGNSHGFAYFQYEYNEENPAEFNDYANRSDPSQSFWSILISSHPSADPAANAALLAKAGAVAYRNLTTSTVVPHADPGAYSFGTLSYDSDSLTGEGIEVLGPEAVTLTVSRGDFSFNALGESTEPGTWVGYPYYYWGVDSNYTLGTRDLAGAGLMFVDGVLVGIDLAAVAEIKAYGGFVTWTGTLRVTERGFAYDINELQSVSGLGDMRVVMDRAGPISLPGASPAASGRMTLEAGGGGHILRLDGWPAHGYRIERSTDLAEWSAHAWIETDAEGRAGLAITLAGAGEPRVFFRAVRLAPGETPPEP